ncbi:4,4'-diaponeurosporene oxidase [Bacillus sp. TS-2]|nr:4,4'-diaponeurosporene oxidase [Bacillus sp. TS-2]
MQKNRKKVIVIGGGLGGLSAAISLAQENFDVTLFEKNEHLGGKLNRLEQDGFGFDLGPSILTMPHIFERLFARSGLKMKDYLEIIRINHEWRTFHTNGKKVDLYGDLQEMLQKNEELSDKDIQDYEKFLKYAKKLYDATDRGYFAKGLDNMQEILKEHGIINSLRSFHIHSTMYDGIDKYIRHPELKKSLAYFIKYVGSSPYDAPAVLNMMIYMQHKQGVWYVPGGMNRIADALVKLAKEVGVTFHLSQAVQKLHKEKGKITAVELEDGYKYSADYYVSNMEVIPTYEKLLQEDKKEIEKMEEKFEPSSSGLVLHLGVKGSYPQLAHHNFFFSHDLKEQMDKVFHKKELPDDPTIYLVNANKTDKSQAPSGYENLKVLPHIPYIQDNPFTKEDYKQLRERVLIKLEKMGLRDLRKNIVTEDMWTPHDIQRMYGSHRGSIYGTVSDKKKNKGFKHPKQSEKYDNLYFAGGTVNPGGGMPMVVLSGQQVRDKIVQKESDHKG